LSLAEVQVYATRSLYKHSNHRPRVFADYLAVARSIIRQGIFSESRNSYWKFIATAALRYRKTFDTAMTFLAVMGHHFQTLTRMVCEAD